MSCNHKTEPTNQLNPRGELSLLGVYEDFFDKNSMGVETLYHTVSIVFEATLSRGADIRLDQQHGEWKWTSELPERLKIQVSTRGRLEGTT